VEISFARAEFKIALPTHNRLIVCSFIAVLVLLASCKSGDRRFSIEGDIKDMPVQNVILEQLNANDIIAIVDSERSDKNGKFVISAIAPEPGLYRLHFQDNSFILLSIDKGVIKVNSDWKTIENYSVSGSAGSESLKKFIVAIREHLRDFNTLTVVMDSLKAQGKDSVLNVAKKDFEDLRVRFTGFVEHYADTTTFEPNAIFAARFLNSSSEGPFIGTFAQTLERRFAGTKMTRDFMEYYHKISSKEKSNKVEKGRVDVGYDAPETSSPSPDGKLIALSDFKGKYILVEFWASWSPQCRKENPNLVKAYEKFKDKNFVIYSISLDNKKEDWVNAIQQDKLSWINVSELKGMNGDAAKLYGIETLPFNFLVDPTGKVIARDLRGEQLSEILRQFIK
jgi:peroxiredoxin